MNKCGGNMKKLLSVLNLNFKYTDDYILENLQFDIEENTYNAVLAPNNGGKTTLIRILTGILQSNDNVCIDEVLLNKKNLKKYSLMIGSFFFNDKINFLFEDVMSELVFGLENLCYSRKKIEKRLKEVIKIFNIDSILNKKTYELTDFEKVKVGIASSLMHEPKLLLLDDIYENLSYFEYLEVTKSLKKYISSYGLTVLYTTSFLDNCLECDKILLLNNKKIELSDGIDTFLSKDNMLARLGINISTMLDMSLKLKFYGLTDKILMSSKDMVDELWK